MRVRDGDAVFVKGVLHILIHAEEHGIIVLLLHPDEYRDFDAAVEVVGDVDLRLRVGDDQRIFGDHPVDHALDLGETVVIADGVFQRHAARARR